MTATATKAPAPPLLLEVCVTQAITVRGELSADSAVPALEAEWQRFIYDQHGPDEAERHLTIRARGDSVGGVGAKAAGFTFSTTNLDLPRAFAQLLARLADEIAVIER